MRRPPAPLVVAGAFLAGSVPFSQIAAKLTRGVDLRDVGNGTVSGTGLYEVAGFGPLAVAGVLEVAKGAVGPALAGSQRPQLRAVAAAAGVAGHNWSPWLRGAGGRGISPSVGALLVSAPSGAAVLLGGMAVGRVLKETGLGGFVADAILVPVVHAVHGRAGAWSAFGVLTPMITKRLLGDRFPPNSDRRHVLRNRLLFDRDTDSVDGVEAGPEPPSDRQMHHYPGECIVRVPAAGPGEPLES